MGTVPKTKRYVAHMMLWVGLALAIPLWVEFHEPGHLLWNIFLAAFLVALVAAVFFGLRYLQTSGIEVGEARFAPRSDSSGISDSPDRDDG
ncbi:hypothetical protein D6851_09435 [Altericroceibacterium spongiae]|uniref:Uncharacterized protein n=2 Tax=Altericroceibacterium spongiae TaxID=2320269 RepID=A0A420EKE5_9SPHN|nr:hypothetical protein D6851_09435 [Altericroceibacterium spongiae]